MKNYNWKDFKKDNEQNEVKEIKSLSSINNINSSNIIKENNASSRKTQAKHTWIVYVTPEVNDKVTKLMSKHRWNRTQALNYIFEVFFNKENIN